jgi:Ydr279p protein family (RNase H2 complex component) wHTH domain/Ydr279p protein triple barrel domain
MGVQTRSSASSSPVKSKTITKITLPRAEEEPYKIFVLPLDISKDARFVFLKNPPDGVKRPYYFCPLKGLFEVTKLHTSVHDPRSILFAPGEEAVTTHDGRIEDKQVPTLGETEHSPSEIVTNCKGNPFGGYVNKIAEILVATPFDPVFILLPLLDRPASNSRGQSGEGLFRPFDDLLDERLEDDRHLHHVLTDHTFRPLLLTAMHQICDSVDAGDERMYRLSMPKLYEYILYKAQRVAENGLPASLEDRFVTRSLEMPIPSIKREESTISSVMEEHVITTEPPTPDASESQSSTASRVTSVAISEATSATSVNATGSAPPRGLHYLQSLRTALSFITASYLDPTLAAKLAEISKDGKASPDFAPLDKHLEQVAKMRAEALASRSLNDFSRKRNLDDDEAAEDRAEKKRKQEDDDKKKKSQESRGVRDLKKVNVSGMKKMSDFFGKKNIAGKPKS